MHTKQVQAHQPKGNLHQAFRATTTHGTDGALWPCSSQGLAPIALTSSTKEMPQARNRAFFFCEMSFNLHQFPNLIYKAVTILTHKESCGEGKFKAKMKLGP